MTYYLGWPPYGATNARMRSSGSKVTWTYSLQLNTPFGILLEDILVGAGQNERFFCACFTRRQKWTPQLLPIGLAPTTGPPHVPSCATSQVVSNHTPKAPSLQTAHLHVCMSHTPYLACHWPWFLNIGEACSYGGLPLVLCRAAYRYSTRRLALCRGFSS